MIKRFFVFFCVVLPLILLIVDIVNKPTFFNKRIVKNKISTTKLIETKYAPIGVLSGSNVGIIYDKVRNGESNIYINGDSGFVISAFVSDGEVGLSELGMAVRDKIAASSAGNAEKLVSFLKNADRQKPGNVASLALERPDKGSFPFNYLVIVFLPQDIHENGQLLEAELRKISREAELLKLSTLVVPVIGFSWRDRNSTNLDAFFNAALKSLENRKYPSNYFINFYSDWPTYVLVDAVHSLNSVWGELADGPIKINQLRLRLILITSCLCLVNIFIRKKKAFNLGRYIVIVSTFYLGASGVADFLKNFCEEDTITYAISLLVMLLVLTALFEIISRYTVEGFFKNLRRQKQ